MNASPHSLLTVEELKIAFRTENGMFYTTQGLSFSHNANEWLGIMGPSGSGKTVLAKSIAGFPSGVPGVISGKIVFRGNDLLEGLARYVSGTDGEVKKDVRAWTNGLRSNYAKHARNRFAYIFQNPYDALNPYMKIRRHLAEAYTAARVPEKEWEERGAALLASLKLENPKLILKKYPHELSGGMAQRVVVALALAQGASYIIADECTTSLDLDSTMKVLEVLGEVKTTGDCSILFITHDTGLARVYSDRILRMERGSLVS